MAASIEQLKSLMSQKGGAARPNLFRVKLPSLPGATSRDIDLLCRDVTLPGRQIMTTERQIGMKQVKVGYGYTIDDVTMNFLVLNDYGIRKYFEVWQNLVVNQTTFELGYKRDYVATITIEQLKKGMALPIYSTSLGIPRLPAELQNRLPKVGPFDLAQGEIDLDFITSDQVIYKCTLQNAFPTTINVINLNNEPGGLTELSVTLAYDNWTSEFPNSAGTAAKSLGDTLTASLVGALTNR